MQKDFFNIQGKKRNHSRAMVSIFNEVDYKISQHKTSGYSYNITKMNFFHKRVFSQVIFNEEIE